MMISSSARFPSWSFAWSSWSSIFSKFESVGKELWNCLPYSVVRVWRLSHASHRFGTNHANASAVDSDGSTVVQCEAKSTYRALLVRKHTDCSDLYLVRDEIWLSHVAIPFKTCPVQNVFLSEWSNSIHGHTIPLELLMLLLHTDATTSCTSRNSALALEGFDGELPSTLPWHGLWRCTPGTPWSITSYKYFFKCQNTRGNLSYSYCGKANATNIHKPSQFP